MMMKEIEHLFKKRFKVIADFPLSVHAVGEVLIPESDNCIKCVVEGGYWATNLSKYPHLFKELAWWEEQKKEEMPEYLKIVTVINGHDNIGEVIKAKAGAYSSHCNYGYKTDENGFVTGFDNIYLDCFLPATEQEYITSKQLQPLMKY